MIFTTEFMVHALCWWTHFTGLVTEIHTGYDRATYWWTHFTGLVTEIHTGYDRATYW